MQKLFYFTFFILLSSCSNQKEPKAINIGRYLFDFPNDFKLVNEKGIDSYVGKIKSESIELDFNYGYYSNTLVETQHEYLNKKFWRHDAEIKFMKEGITYDMNNSPKIEVIGLRPTVQKDRAKFKVADFIATCKHDSIIFNFPIVLPDEIKQHIVRIDTVQNQLRRIVIAKKPMTGLTGIYLKDIKGSNKSKNDSIALSMATTKLTKQQQDMVLKIFSTMQLVREK